MRSRSRSDAWRSESGSVTAEFAMILPAVAVVLALGVGVVQLGSVRVALTDAAADAARILGRGDSEGAAASRVAQAQRGARMSVDHLGPVVCVTARAEVSPGLGALFSFEGRGCALDDTMTPVAESPS
ncbi:TadE family type IV pilus minor pilin [Herbiconiux sp. P16]|uniref:TadE family type IV pilus minor pilin n=1 Tax=Herbiconiux wuyangfengii TaxID=3342794 RepID=UPI0035BA32F6